MQTLQTLNVKTVCEIVRDNENDYVNGTTQISEYVEFSMHDTIENIIAYLNSKHLSGKKDSQGRDKPFFNIVTAASNIWFRATDIDRSDIKVSAPRASAWVQSFLANVLLQDWMNKANFGAFLNEWGRVLARFGSAVIKFVENSEGLHISVVPWSKLIVDPVDFYPNPKIEILELTEAELRDNPSYDQVQVDALISATQTRQTLNKQRKDVKSDYYKLYEVHGKFALYLLTGKEEDKRTFVEQMHVVSFVGGKMKGGKNDYQDFTLFKGRKRKPAYMLTHLIKEDDRTLAIGAVEHLFEAQWMQNHTALSIKNTLDLSSKLVFQTSDPTFAGQNALSAIETGDILVHNIDQPLTQLNNQSHDITSWQNYATTWKNLGNEITGISEAMLGAMPKSGTAWRQTEALLQESYNLFELMTENKGLYIAEMMREYVLPYIKRTKLDTKDEIVATLERYDLDKIDADFVKTVGRLETNKQLKEATLKGQVVSPEEQAVMTSQNEMGAKDYLNKLGGKRYFAPSEISDSTWKEMLEDFEWNVDVDVTGERKNIQEIFATLSTVLKVIATPGFDQNKKAQRIVNKILELTGAISPLELDALAGAPTAPMGPTDGSTNGATSSLGELAVPTQ